MGQKVVKVLVVGRCPISARLVVGTRPLWQRGRRHGDGSDRWATAGRPLGRSPRRRRPPLLLRQRQFPRFSATRELCRFFYDLPAVLIRAPSGGTFMTKCLKSAHASQSLRIAYPSPQLESSP